jgi:hypothetical protein
MGQEQILNALNRIQFNNLKIDHKFVLVQPIFGSSSYEYAGIVILASGTVNLLENGIYVNKNIHLNFILDNVGGAYYLNNLLVRLSEKSRQITQHLYNYTAPMNLC